MSVYGAIIKHKLRTAKGLLKHFWPSFAGLLLGTVFLGHRLLVQVMGIGLEAAPEPRSVFYLLCACVGLNGYRVLLAQTPVFRVNAATLHYLYHTVYFRKIMKVEYLWALLKNMLASLLLAGLICGFQLGLSLLLYFMLLSGYLYSGALLSWIRYHDHGRLCWVTIAIYLLASAGLFVPINALRFILIGGTAIWSACYVFRDLQCLDLVKYKRDITFHDTNTASASQFDMAKMSQITAEHNANRQRSFFLHQLPLRKENAVFFKCLIEMVRAGKRIWIIMLSILMVGILSYRTPIFAGLPIIGDPAMAAPIGILLIMTAYANIGELIKQQLNILLKKHRQGLFLPVRQRQVWWSYVLFGMILYLAITILVGLLMVSKGHFMLLFYVLYGAVFALDIYIEINVRRRRAKRAFQTVLRVFTVILGFLFVL